MKYSFESIFVYLKRGFRVRRAGWAAGAFLELHRGSTFVWFCDGYSSPAPLTELPTVDLFAKDWELVAADISVARNVEDGE